MEQRTKSRTSLGVGTASILMIFVLLILVTFAVLSLSSAKADSRLSGKTVEHAKQYYRAENLAEGKIAEIDKLLNSRLAKNEMFIQIEEIEGVEVDIEKELISYKEQINEKQFLEVVISFRWDDEIEKYSYNKEKWETVVDVNWNADDELPVFKPGN